MFRRSDNFCFSFYHTVGTFTKYHTVGIFIKYHSVGTFTKYHTIGTFTKYHTVGTFTKYHTVGTFTKYYTIGTFTKSIIEREKINSLTQILTDIYEDQVTMETQLYLWHFFISNSMRFTINKIKRIPRSYTTHTPEVGVYEIQVMGGKKA
jgi:hypothetical protein